MLISPPPEGLPTRFAVGWGGLKMYQHVRGHAGA